MLLECICRLCLTKSNPNHLFTLVERQLDEALVKIFNKNIKPELKHLYKICPPCASKLVEFHNFYMNVQQNEEKVWNIVLNEKIVTNSSESPAMPCYVPIPSDQITIGSEIEINNDDVEMSSDGFDTVPTTETTLSTRKLDFDSYSPLHEFRQRNPSISTSFDVSNNSVEKEQPMEVEPPPAKPQRQKSRCKECGVYVLNVKQHMKCVHDFSGVQKCTDCGSVFPNRLKLLMHKYYKHVPPRYKCEFCNKEIRTKALLREHVYQKHIDGVYLYKCEFCDSQFNYRTSLVLHQKRFHPHHYENAKEKRLAMRYRP